MSRKLPRATPPRRAGRGNGWRRNGDRRAGCGRDCRHLESSYPRQRLIPVRAPPVKRTPPTAPPQPDATVGADASSGASALAGRQAFERSRGCRAAPATDGEAPSSAAPATTRAQPGLEPSADRGRDTGDRCRPSPVRSPGAKLSQRQPCPPKSRSALQAEPATDGCVSACGRRLN